MKVFISSTSEDLKDHRKVVRDLILDAGWQPVAMEHFPADPRPIVQLCREEVAACDLVVLIQAWRRGWVPGRDKGGDDVTSITGWEVKAADEGEPKVPVLAFLADDGWPRRLSDHAPDALQWVESFREGLNRNARFFRWEEGEPVQFRALVRESLARHRERITVSRQETSESIPEPRWVDAEPPNLPQEPYPLLGPYEHPRTFAGREREIQQLTHLVRLSPLILCVHAPSGAGKSSLLLAGLAPRLRAEGYLVSVERAPGDPGVASRLIADVLVVDPSAFPPDDDERLPALFAAAARQAHNRSNKPVVFILDQIDDVLRNPEKRHHALATIGSLLAATAQRLPGVQAFACKWVLCYRHEFHGTVRAWLEDVLVEARARKRQGLALLPADLSDAQKSHDWALPVFGKLSSDALDGDGSKQAFLRAITTPLQIEDRGRRHYGYVIPGDGADRLASVFAQMRRNQPDVPFVPELQVVLNDLLRRARERHGGDAGSPIVVEVPQGQELTHQIRHALRDHLEQALNRAVPHGRTDAAGLQLRTRALLALRQLVDTEGRRAEGVPQERLIEMIGPEGPAVLAKLSAADTRVVVFDRHGLCELSHDLLAEALRDVLGSEEKRRGLVVDQALIDLQRTVARKAELYASEPTDASALVLTRRQRETIRQLPNVLLQIDGHRAWWAASEAARRRRRKGWLRNAAAGILMLLAVAYIAWTVFGADRERQRLHSELLAALSGGGSYADLVRVSREFSGTWSGMGPLSDRTLNSVSPALFAVEPWTQSTFESADLLDVIERGHSLFVPSPPLFGAMSFALEEVFVRHPENPPIRDRARALSDQMRAAFIAHHQERIPGFQPPPARAQDDPLSAWVELPPGEFEMGSEDGDSDERPTRLVRMSAFAMQQHEVTNEEYRRFDPRHDVPAGNERHPANVTWYDAVAYAAWLGASLPTEAQWEYAARGTGATRGRRYPWGNDPPDETRAVYGIRTPGALAVGSQPGGRTPEGLEDMAGNVWEWCRDGYGPYDEGSTFDPLGPIARDAVMDSGEPLRVLRGGKFDDTEYSLRAAGRRWGYPGGRFADPGFRLVSSRLRP